MSITIYDVAKHANVGIGTVSRAINNSPQIRAETKKKVMRAIKELGYSPHAIAQGLARKRTGILAAIMPFYTGHFYHELLRGIMQALAKFEYDLILYYVDRPGMKYEFLSRTLHERRCDGVLAFSIDIPDNFAAKFIDQKVPIILVDRAHNKIDSIQVKNEDGAYAATKHLIELGHKRIAMISGHATSTPAEERFNGYTRALKEANLAVDASIHVTADMLDSDKLLEVNDGFNEKTGELAMNYLLKSYAQDITAIFAASDILAVGAMKSLREHQYTIPDDYSIIGFDDIELASYLTLTTMQQPMFEMGRMAVQRIMEKLEDKNSPARHVQLSPTLVKRNTTASR